MCGRYALTSDAERLEERFVCSLSGVSYSPRYNIAPTQPVLALINAGSNELTERRAGFLRWGLIPSWAKDPSVGAKMINARSETVAEKPSFKRALRRRRCLIVADGFYEWKKDGTTKTPLYIGLHSGEPFALAGLWEKWVAESGEAIYSCTILTTSPNALMAPIHHRMPVILPPEAEALWLDRTVQEPDSVLPLLVPYPAEAMTAYAVSMLVNSPRNDSPECLRPLDPVETSDRP